MELISETLVSHDSKDLLRMRDQRAAISHKLRRRIQSVFQLNTYLAMIKSRL